MNPRACEVFSDIRNAKNFLPFQLCALSQGHSYIISKRDAATTAVKNQVATRFEFEKGRVARHVEDTISPSPDHESSTYQLVQLQSTLLAVTAIEKMFPLHASKKQ